MDSIAFWIVHFWFQIPRDSTKTSYTTQEVKAMIETGSSKTIPDIIEQIQKEYWLKVLYFTKIESIPVTSVIRF